MMPSAHSHTSSTEGLNRVHCTLTYQLTTESVAPDDFLQNLQECSFWLLSFLVPVLPIHPPWFLIDFVVLFV